MLLPPEGLQRRARPPRRVPRSRPGPRRRRRRSAPLNNITIYYLLLCIPSAVFLVRAPIDFLFYNSFIFQ